MKKVLETFRDNVQKIDGYVAVSVTEIESGISYISDTIKQDFDPELASAYNLEVVKAKLKAVEALGLKAQIEDITITLDNQVHILNVATSGSFFVYLAIDSAKSNLGLAKSLLNKYKKELYEAL